MDGTWLELYIFGSGVVDLYKHCMHYAEAAINEKLKSMPLAT